MTPLNVVLEAKSFTVSETGEISYRALDPNIHLKLSTTSFRIQPQQTYYVFYEASSPQILRGSSSTHRSPDSRFARRRG